MEIEGVILKSPKSQNIQEKVGELVNSTKPLKKNQHINTHFFLGFLITDNSFKKKVNIPINTFLKIFQKLKKTSKNIFEASITPKVIKD